jgi:hypothetical protein
LTRIGSTFVDGGFTQAALDANRTLTGKFQKLVVDTRSTIHTGVRSAFIDAITTLEIQNLDNVRDSRRSVAA